MKTQVIFRTFLDGGDVIALFPLEPCDLSSYNCQSYQHIGQHGAACPSLMATGTRRAKPEEYASLKAELERIGYDLEIYERFPRNALEVRQQKIAEMSAH